MASSKWLALEWDRREVRVLALDGSGRQTRLEGAYVFPFGANGPPEDAEGLAQFVRQSLTSAGLSAKSVSVVAGADEVVLRHLRLPPAPEDELASMVRFQAAGELTSTLEGAGLDYTRLPGRDGEQEISLLAAVLPTAAMQRRAKMVEVAGLSARHCVMRGHASGEALRERLRVRGTGSPAGGPGAKLLVDFTAETACFTVLVDGHCAVTRWRRLPHGAEDASAPDAAFIAGEVARTLTAFHAQFPAWNVDEVFLAGGDQERSLAEEVAKASGRPVDLFDPTELIPAPPAQGWPEGHGRFCALAGLALWARRGAKPPIDFLHPKEPAKRVGHAKRLALTLGSAAAVLVGVVTLWYVLTQRALAQELKTLQADVQRHDAKLKEYADVERDFTAVREWHSTAVIWLDELYAVSERFPEAQDAHISRLDFMPGSGQLKNRMRLNGAARQEGAVDSFYSEMRKQTKRYVVIPKGIQQQTSGRDYPWEFQAEIQVTPPGGPTAGEAPRNASTR